MGRRLDQDIHYFFGGYMQKLLVALILLTVSTFSYADIEVVNDSKSLGIYIVDDKSGKVVFCWRDKYPDTKQCYVLTDNFRQEK